MPSSTRLKGALGAVTAASAVAVSASLVTAAPSTAQADHRADHRCAHTAPRHACRQPADRRPARRTPGRRPPARSRGSSSAPPVLPAGGGRELPEGNPDPFRSLGAGSPFCRRPSIAPRASCRISGSIANTYPISNYGLDIQVDTGVTKVENNLLAALQSVAAFCWLCLIYLLKGVLLLLEWAFSLDLLNAAMRGVRSALEHLHQRVLGRPWFLAALSVAGLWGIWRGLVQRRTLQTFAGLLAALGLMLAALVLIAEPEGTVGRASRLADQGALGFMSAASTGVPTRPAESYVAVNQRLFRSLVLGPWCALQFGDVRWCERHRPGGFSNADLWLAFPADGKEREGLYRLTKGDDAGGGGFFSDLKRTVGRVLSTTPGGLGPALLGLRLLESHNGGGLPPQVKALVQRAPGRVRMQEKAATFTRLALLALVALGLLGASAVLLYLAIKLVLAGLLSLVLLLLAPAMLFAPALGDSGRATFLGWLKRLLGALAAKLIYALLLAVVVVAAGALAGLPIGWFGTWLLQIAFWWGILLKRKELLGFVSAGHLEPSAGAGGLGIGRLYYEARAARALAGGAGAAAAALPKRVGRQAAAAGLAREETTRRATHKAARAELDRRADEVRERELRSARERVALRPELEHTRRALARELAPYDAEVVRAVAEGRAPRPPSERERRLLAQRAAVERRLGPEMQRAEALVRRSRPFGDHDRAAWREQRRADIERGLAPEHERSLLAAGIDPAAYRASEGERRAALLERSKQAIERDRELLAAVPADPREAPTPKATARAARLIPPDELRRRRGDERVRNDHERRLRRRRQRLYRR
jgi:hypothetical protein